MSIGIKIYGVLSIIYSIYMLPIVVNPNTYHAPYMIRAGYVATTICWTIFGIGILRRYSWARVGLIAIAIIYSIDYISYYPERILSLIKNLQLNSIALSIIFFISIIIYFNRPKIKKQFGIANAPQNEALNNRRALLKERDNKILTAPRRDTVNSMKLHPIFYVWIIVKLIYIHIEYLTGMSEESFYIARANCFIDLQWYDRAIISYERALIESDRASVHSVLGYCYYQIGEYSSSVEHYRKAYKRLRDRSADIGLAAAEFQLGDIDKSAEIIQELRDSNYSFEQEHKIKLDSLESKIAIAKKARH